MKVRLSGAVCCAVLGLAAGQNTTDRVISITVPSQANYAIAFSPDGRAVYTGTFSDTVGQAPEIEKYNVKSGKLIQTLVMPCKECITGTFDLSPDGMDVAANVETFSGKTTLIVDTTSGKNVASLPTSGVPTYHPDGKFIAINGSNGKSVNSDVIDIYSVENKTLITSLAFKDVNFQPANVSFSPVGNLLAYGTSSDGTYLIDFLKHQRARTFAAGNYASPAFSPDGSTLLVRSAFSIRSINVWSVYTSRLLGTLPHKTGAAYATFSPDGRWIASIDTYDLDSRLPGGHQRGFVYLWDARTLKLARTFKQLGEFNTNIVFSPDGSTLGAVGPKELNLGTLRGGEIHLMTLK